LIGAQHRVRQLLQGLRPDQRAGPDGPGHPDRRRRRTTATPETRSHRL